MTVPATVGLVLLRVPIVRVLFQGGRYDAEDTAATALVLATLALGLFFFALVRVVVPAFYALRDTRLPVLAALADMTVFLVLSAVWTPRLGLPGIGLASSCAAAVNVAILLGVLRRREGRLHGRAIAASVVRMAVASAAMGALVWGADRAIGLAGLPLWPAAAALFAIIAAAAGTYWLAAHLLGSPEPAELSRLLSRRRN